MDELSTNLFHLLHQNHNNNNGDMTLMSQRPPKERLRRLQADYMLLACGTIVCACVSVHGSVFANNVIFNL
jgi:hypothetical protein